MPISLAQLYDEHAEGLFRFLLQVTRSEAEARDGLQEVFCRLAEDPACIADVENVRGFLFRMAHNWARDQFRRSQARENKHEAAQAGAEVFTEAAEADVEFWREQVEAGLAELPEEQRAVVHLRVWEQLSWEEIAEALGCSLPTASSRYRYALDKLRGRLRLYREENL